MVKHCEKCKQDKPVDEFYVSSGNKSGYQTWCKVCMLEYAKCHKRPSVPSVPSVLRREYSKRYYRSEKGHKYYQEYSKKYEKSIHRQAYLRSPRGRYKQYKASAKKRNLIWNITLEQFMQFWQRPCSYCGESIRTIGLDRIDSAKGYELENLESCCTACNFWKRETSQEVFLNKIRTIALCRRLLEVQN